MSSEAFFSSDMFRRFFLYVHLIFSLLKKKVSFKNTFFSLFQDIQWGDVSFIAVSCFSGHQIMEFSTRLILIGFESACFCLLLLETANNQLSLNAVWVLNNFQPQFNYGHSVSINSNISFVF